ncbi:PHD finger protein 21A-like isoform X2 [Dendronephthya gigantea]|uniref:PHD finger protein 21A-like isoform X2 n=1 Tax=Dendronephthya gigantea TaxID=151771 RepID=UPI00106D6D39|nr:PHD finger protein 21A-like isoform X2 [Dendronephthya gigantea]XP_028417201.1 PHD finger protein 21A-like isoform X2 [Dendronephthya gigantea]
MDLEKIQAQLKSHIHQHQILIEEMKRDPQNIEIQQKVQSLQAELTSLSEKQKYVVKQLKQNIKPRSEVYSNEQDLLSRSHHHQIPSTSDYSRTERSPRRPSMINMSAGRHSGLNTLDKQTTKFIPTITQNNIVSLKEGREVRRKPDMVTTGMQTVPTGKIERTVLARPDTKKASLGIQYSKPVEQRSAGKQNTEKLNFLSTLGLITVSKCREINSQKNERRRRTSAIFSPYSSFQFFDEPKRPSPGIKRGRGRPSKSGENGLKSPISPSPVFVPINGFKTPNDDHPSAEQISRNISSDSSPKVEEHEDHCAVCQQSGEVLMCDTCILVYHLKCLTPPLTSIPTGMWMCPKCQENIKNKEPMEWPGTLAVAHSYLKHRAEKDKEKQNLLNRNQELKLQELELQRKVNELSSAIVIQIQKKAEIVESTKQAQEKLHRLKKFIQTVHSSH